MKNHIPVLLDEVIKGLNLKENYNVIDATLGGGGHSEKILEKISPNGILIGVDLDDNAIKLARNKLNKFESRAILIKENYKNLKKIIHEQYPNIQIHGVLLDLGLSLYQLQDTNRGFSFLNDKFSMKFDENSDGEDAQEIINSYAQEKLEKIFKEFGEEKLSSQIAKEIVNHRNNSTIKTSKELAEIIERVYKKFYRQKSKIHPATKVFQALRIYINKEFDNIKSFLRDAIDILETGGRLTVITFHSLEDRIVKQIFKDEACDCICPKNFPKCVCDHRARIKIINNKVIIPSEKEIRENAASRSAKLRIIEKL
ncbi:MAG: 16S rRNA (cytosine(1402)-N(4))-methyltransferase RsmH [Patescibacteria group bacterium]|nr:16S rRNA (cytosine(1402)-N(4))-methyltransferase RsmH [Patescibacteria group bacterium]